MAGANLDEGMKGAGRDVEAKAVREEASYLAVGSSSSAQLSDQFAMRLQFRARRFRREVCKIGEQHR
jgi:hypothetical protein